MRLARTLSQEGFRLFFPLSALYAATFPVIWLASLSLGLPLAQEVPAALWHAHEMIVGALGAALIGFLTTAAPEWTDTKAPQGPILWGLCGLWAIGRVCGLAGWSGAGTLGALADLAWLGGLTVWLCYVSLQRRTDRFLAFILWLGLLTASVAGARGAFLLGDITWATTGVHLAGYAFLGLLGLALGRITVPITNRVLDPSERTSPYRPHPGRMSLAPGLLFIAWIGEVAPLSPQVTGFLLIAAGAAFMDRVAEGFVGRATLRAEILLLAGASALAGLGLILAGAARLGAPWSEVAGLHVAFMGGLGLGIYGVFSIAGLLHTDRPLGLSLATRIGALILVVAVAMRVAPDFGLAMPGPLHALASMAWAAAFLVWLAVYWPFLSARTPAAPSAAAQAAE